MIIKTKKYQLTSSIYIKTALMNILKEFWWVWFIPLAIIIVGAIFPVAFWWCLGGAILLSVLYVAFWWIQFAGATQMEQSKMMFDRYSYEIDSRQILMKKNAKEGMAITWNLIQKLEKNKTAYILYLSKGQFLYFPFDLFKSEHELRFLESIFKRKGLIQGEEKKAA